MCAFFLVRIYPSALLSECAFFSCAYIHMRFFPVRFFPMCFFLVRFFPVTVWRDRNSEPLRQMAERHVNMTDVRKRLGIKSVKW